MTALTQDQKNGLTAIGESREKAGLRRNLRQYGEALDTYTEAAVPRDAWLADNPYAADEPIWKTKARLAVTKLQTAADTAKTNELAAIVSRLPT